MKTIRIFIDTELKTVDIVTVFRGPEFRKTERNARWDDSMTLERVIKLMNKEYPNAEILLSK